MSLAAQHCLPAGLLQVEVHPYHRNDALIAFCRAHSIHVTAFSPLGSPDSASIFPRKRPLVLMEDATVQVDGGPWGQRGKTIALRNDGAVACGSRGGVVARWWGGGLLSLCRCLPACPPAPQAVAERSGRNVGQVLIRWALQHGTSVIPKSTSPARIKWVARWGS